MEDLFEIRITEGRIPAGSFQFLLLNTKYIEEYSPVLQVTLLRDHFNLPVAKTTLPFWYVLPIHCNLSQTPQPLLSLSD